MSGELTCDYVHANAQIVALKNTGRTPTAINCDASALPPGVTVAPAIAVIEPGATCSLTVTVECPAATIVNHEVVIDWRGRAASAKKISLNVTANVCVPSVKLMETRLNFGGTALLIIRLNASRHARL